MQSLPTVDKAARLRARGRRPSGAGTPGRAASWHGSCLGDPTVSHPDSPPTVDADGPVTSVSSYADILGVYFTNRAEEALYRASLLSQRFIDEGLGPEEIIAVHAEAVEIASRDLSYRERVQAATDALQFLLEVMIAYGVQYRDYLDLRLRERERDVEARLALERQRAADAEQSEREKQAILATISHELRTPITAAMGNIDLVQRGLARAQYDAMPRRLAAARDALGRLSRLTDDLVGASHDGLPLLTFRPLDVDVVLRTACAWARPNAEQKGLALRDGELTPCQVLGDADALLTVFGNLLSNAIRYTPDGGRIEVRCGADGDGAWCSIADSGVGMSAETQARIFEKFFRAPDALRAEPRGLGLGLSIAQRLVDAHGGHLDVTSSYGQGSTFVVRLPRLLPRSDDSSGGVQHERS